MAMNTSAAPSADSVDATFEFPPAGAPSTRYVEIVLASTHVLNRVRRSSLLFVVGSSSATQRKTLCWWFSFPLVDNMPLEVTRSAIVRVTFWDNSRIVRLVLQSDLTILSLSYKNVLLTFSPFTLIFSLPEMHSVGP